MRWDNVNGYLTLPRTTQSSFARDISADGKVIVGTDANRAFRWTEAGGKVDIGSVPAGYQDIAAWAVSADGAVATGSFRLPTRRSEAARWTESTGWVGLGDLAGGAFHSLMTDISADGSTVIGYSSETPEFEGGRGIEPFIWDAQQGMRNLTDLLRNDPDLAGSMAGWNFYSAEGMSEDRRTVAGWGYQPDGQWAAWIAHVSTPIAEPSTLLLSGLGLISLTVIRRQKRRRRWPLSNPRMSDGSRSTEPALCQSENKLGR
jgi:hypothetical protein